MRRLSGQAATRVWLALSAVVLVALSTEVGAEYQRYKSERELAAEVFKRLESRLTLRAIAELKADPAMTQREVELFKSGILSDPAASIAESIVAATAPVDEGRVFIPVGEGWHLFLSTNPYFKYGDVRRLTGAYSQVNDYAVVETMLRTGTSYETSFWSYLGATYLAGRAFRDAEDRTTAVVLVGSQLTPASIMTFRWWWRLFLGRAIFTASPEVRSLRGARQ